MFIKHVAGLLASAFALGGSAASVPSDPEVALATVNNERILNGLFPLIWNTNLAIAATNWAGYLGQVGSVIHATEAQRVGQGEVIAHYTSTTPDDAWVHPYTHAVNDWLAERSSYPAGAVIGADSGPWIHWGHVGQTPFASTTNSVMRRQDLAPGPFNGELTHYTTGLGACGHDDTGAPGIIALSQEKMGAPSNGNPLCDRRVRLSANGISVEGTVRDKCMGCKKEDIDVSEDLFIALYGDLGIGRAPVSWELI
ncbi:hypothetical protein ACHAQA_009733 [Verticillium albo-atrum]